MPIMIPHDLPAEKTLEKYNIFVMGYERTTKRDIQPLKIIIINFIPTEIATERNLQRFWETSAANQNRTYIFSDRKPKRTSQEHII